MQDVSLSSNFDAKLWNYPSMAKLQSSSILDQNIECQFGILSK